MGAILAIGAGCSDGERTIVRKETTVVQPARPPVVEERTSVQTVPSDESTTVIKRKRTMESD
jgi:hypothetical protein